MFSPLKRITDKAADALDLAIELVTLGEYGLEYPETAAPESFSAARNKTRAAEKDDCHSRGRTANRRRATPRPSRRPGSPAVPVRNPSRPSRPLSPGSPADIIRTPRIQPDWTRV